MSEIVLIDVNKQKAFGEAMDIYPKLKKMNANERKAYQSALLAYCKLDTLAMVEVLAKLKEVL